MVESNENKIEEKESEKDCPGVISSRRDFALKIIKEFNHPSEDHSDAQKIDKIAESPGSFEGLNEHGKRQPRIYPR